MKNPYGISVLFLDIGGVLLTNGWERRRRGRAAEEFGLDFDETNERHNLTFDTYERGLLSLGLHSIYHESLDRTLTALQQLGLT